MTTGQFALWRFNANQRLECAAMECPKCKLVNPPTAMRCDCGYDFQTHTMQKSYLTQRDKQLSRIGAGVAGALLIAFFVLRLMGVAAAKHSFALGIFTVVVAAIFVRFWFWKGKRHRDSRTAP